MRNRKSRNYGTSYSYLQTVFKDCIPSIINVIFNDPATIVIWSDGVKTIVKCQEGDTFDPEKGLAMAICKRMLGNKHDYYDLFIHHLKGYDKKKSVTKKKKEIKKRGKRVDKQ